MPVGKSVVIVGGAIQGCQLAEYLIKRGRNVTVVETGEEMGEWLVPERKTRLFYWFNRKGTERLTGVKLVEITDRGLRLVTEDGQERLLEADNVIPALPFSPNRELYERLQSKVAEAYIIGQPLRLFPEARGLAAGVLTGGFRLGTVV